MRQTVEEGIRSYYTIERLAYEQAVAHAEEIVSIYRECWLTTYPNEELGITRHDIEERFSNFSEVVEKWKKSILS